MIQELVDRFVNNRPLLESKLKSNHPGSYAELVKWVVEIVSSNELDKPYGNFVHGGG